MASRHNYKPIYGPSGTYNLYGKVYYLNTLCKACGYHLGNHYVDHCIRGVRDTVFTPVLLIPERLVLPNGA